jgi:hypothetical protein
LQCFINDTPAPEISGRALDILIASVQVSDSHTEVIKIEPRQGDLYMRRPLRVGKSAWFAHLLSGKNLAI